MCSILHTLADPLVDALTQCGPPPSPPAVGNMKLHITMDGNTETEEVEPLLERGLYVKTSDVDKSIDDSIYIPLNVTTGTIT